MVSIKVSFHFKIWSVTRLSLIHWSIYLDDFGQLVSQNWQFPKRREVLCVLAYGDPACDREIRSEHQAMGEGRTKLCSLGCRGAKSHPREDRNFSGTSDLSSPHQSLGSQQSTWLGLLR